MNKIIVNKVNKLSKLSRSLNFDLIETYNQIYNYCEKNKVHPSKIECTLNNGVLVINGNNIERVAPLVRPFMVEKPEADYYENKILSRAEL